MNMNAKQKIGLTTFLFLSTTVFFQNCSLNKLTSAGTSGSNDVLSNSIAPISTSGISSTVVLASGERLLVAKEYHHKTYDRYFITARVADQQVVEPIVLAQALKLFLI